MVGAERASLGRAPDSAAVVAEDALVEVCPWPPTASLVSVDLFAGFFAAWSAKVPLSLRLW